MNRSIITAFTKYTRQKNLSNEVLSCFFKDQIPSSSKLQEIKSNTDKVFNEIVKQGVAAHNKDKLMKVAKVAGMIGLGAMFGI